MGLGIAQEGTPPFVSRMSVERVADRTIGMEMAMPRRVVAVAAVAVVTAGDSAPVAVAPSPAATGPNPMQE